MFVEVSGFGRDSQIELPSYLRDIDPASVVLALVRWLSPHPDAIVRDSRRRPLCTSPFDINHALWTFTKRSRARASFNDHLFGRSINLFPGNDIDSRRANIARHRYATYDLLDPRSFESYVNCTVIDEDSLTVLETITLPFVVS